MIHFKVNLPVSFFPSHPDQPLWGWNRSMAARHFLRGLRFNFKLGVGWLEHLYPKQKPRVVFGCIGSKRMTATAGGPPPNTIVEFLKRFPGSRVASQNH